MKRKLLLRQLSISAPRMKVKRELGLPLRIAAWVVPLLVCGALMLWAYDLGRHFSSFDSHASDQLSKPGAETNIERATQNQQNEQIKVLEAENTQLKQDLAYFNTLLPTNTGTDTSGIVIQKLAVEAVQPNQLRFRAMVIKSGGDKQRFNGNLQLLVAGQQGSQRVNLVFPNEKAHDVDKYKLGFIHYQRLDGTLMLPEGTTANHVEVRIMEKGMVKAQKTITAN